MFHIETMLLTQTVFWSQQLIAFDILSIILQMSLIFQVLVKYSKFTNYCGASIFSIVMHVPFKVFHYMKRLTFFYFYNLGFSGMLQVETKKI